MAFDFSKVKQSLGKRPLSTPMGIRGMSEEAPMEDEAPLTLDQLPTDTDMQMGLQPAQDPYEQEQQMSYDPNLKKRLNMPMGGGY